MRVLVTGASSMIGRQAVTTLIARGDTVTTLQRSHAGVSGTEILGSVTDASVVAKACTDQDAVLHLAAKVGVTGQWSEYEHVNVDGTALLLQAARAAGVSAFVHVSSPSVAHSGESLIGASASPANPSTASGHYAKSKAFAELLALEATSDQMSVVAIRPHLVWGPGDTQLVGRIIERARAGRLLLVGSGTALIDTTYVDNAADALIAAVDHAAQLGGEAFVVSNGEPRTVSEIVSRLTRAAGVAWSPRHIPVSVAKGGGSLATQFWDRTGRTDDPPMTRFLAEQLSTAHWFDQQATRKALHWEPAVSLAQGFERLAAEFNAGAV